MNVSGYSLGMEDKKVKLQPGMRKCSSNFYAVNAELAATEGVFLLRFEWLGPFDKNGTAIEVIIPPYLAKALAKGLPEQVEKYEKKYGEIKEK